MRNSRLVLLSAIAGVMLLAAGSAFAAPIGGTVYGRATMEPLVDIQLAGSGADGQGPLVYEGRAGSTVGEVGGRTFHVVNGGDQKVQLNLGFGSDPTDGSSTWSLGCVQGATQCIWRFDGDSGPVQVPCCEGDDNTLWRCLAPGESQSFSTQFTFPTSFDGNPHDMSAIITTDEYEEPAL